MGAWGKRLAVAGVGVCTLLLVLSPVAIVSAASDTSNTTVTATVNSVISISTGSTVNISLVPTPTGVVSSSSDTVTVNTNNTAGYLLTVADSDATTTLADGGNSFSAHAGTQGSPTALASGTWGYRVVGAGGFGGGAYSAETNNGSSTSTWAGMPASGAANTIKSTASTATNDTTTVWYGVKADSSQPQGTYTGTITYTAVTN